MHGSSTSSESPESPESPERSLENKTVAVGVIGLGALGLSLALCLQEKYDVFGFDSHGERMKDIEAKRVMSNDKLLLEKLSKHTIHLGTLDHVTKHASVIFVCVNTTLSQSETIFHGCRNVSTVLMDLRTHLSHKPIKHWPIITVCSTLNAGFTDIISQDVPLNYTPLNVKYGCMVTDILHLQRLLIGEHDSHSGDIIQTIFSNICVKTPVFNRCSVLEAEIIELACAGLQSVQISFANSLRQIARKCRVNEQTIIESVLLHTKPPRTEPKAQFDYGGSILPYKLDWLTNFFGRMHVTLPVVRSSIRHNKSYPEILADEILKKLQQTQPQKAYIINVPFDADAQAQTDILNCPRLTLAEELVRRRVEVVINDRSESIQAIKQLYGVIFKYQITSPEL